MNLTPLKIIRTQLGYTQADLAKAINVDLSIISRLENSQLRDTPSIIRAKARIAEFLNMSVEEIFPPEQ